LKAARNSAYSMSPSPETSSTLNIRSARGPGCVAHLPISVPYQCSICVQHISVAYLPISLPHLPISHATPTVCARATSHVHLHTHVCVYVYVRYICMYVYICIDALHSRYTYCVCARPLTCVCQYLCLCMYTLICLHIHVDALRSQRCDTYPLTLLPPIPTDHGTHAAHMLRRCCGSCVMYGHLSQHTCSCALVYLCAHIRLCTQGVMLKRVTCVYSSGCMCDNRMHV